MRINVYREEIPDTLESEIVWTEPRPGVKYCGLRVFLKSAPELHHKAGDDDRSAITFWLGTVEECNLFLAQLHDTVCRAL